MKALEKIQKTREYLDYIERHILNVEKACKILVEKCAGMRFISDDLYYGTLVHEVQRHDLSKLSEHELVQYREVFYKCRAEPTKKLGWAWEHHKENNLHHWESWTKHHDRFPGEWEIHCAHMVIDWMAMGYEFNDTAQSYYEKNKDRILLPDHAVKFLYEIFERLR